LSIAVWTNCCLRPV